MKKANDELLSLKYDCNFKEVNGLNWLPWIGKDYFSSERRVLIVGESHYLTGSEKNLQEVSQQDFTRNVIQTKCIDDKEKDQPTFDNLTRCLFGKKKMNEKEKREKVWQHLAFYNFVQRPMKTNKKRPKPSDMNIGWEVFAELIKILKPTECIFIGFAAVDSCYNPYKCQHSEDIVGRYTARIFSAKIDEQHTCQCIAIKHTSQYFSWKKWRKFLKEEYPDMMKYLKYQFPQTEENSN